MSSISRDTQVVKNTLWEIISTSVDDLSDEKKQWALATWLPVFDELQNKPNDRYKGMVLANRNCAIGRMAIVFNSRLSVAIRKNDTTAFRELLKNPPFPEGDDNQHLSASDKKVIEMSLATEMNALNLTMEKAMKGSNVTPLLDSSLYKQCTEQICTFTEGGSRFDYGPVGGVKYVSEGDGDKVNVYPFRFHELLDLLWRNSSNPYTGKKLDEQLLNSLRTQYRVEILLYIRSTEFSLPK